MELFLVSNWNCFKWVSMIIKFDSRKWIQWIKLFSANLGLEWLMWALLMVSETCMYLPGEFIVWTHTFGVTEKFLDTKRARNYWPIENWLKRIVIIDCNKPATIQIFINALTSKNYWEGFLFFLCITCFAVLQSSQWMDNRVPLSTIYGSIILFKKST